MGVNAIKDVHERYSHFGLIPVSNSGAVVSNYYSTKNYKHVRIDIVSGSAITGSTAITINRANTVAGGDAETWTLWDTVYINANESAYNAEDASETKAFTKTAVTSYTATLSTVNTHWIIEFDAIELDAEGEGWDCFAVAFAAGLTTTIIGMKVDLSDCRFKGDMPPDARSN